MKIRICEEVGMPLGLKRRSAFNQLNEMVYLGKIKVESVESCFCGSESFQLLSRFDRFGLPFGTKICKDCGLITQTIRIQNDSLPEFYEKIYWPLINGDGSYSTPRKVGESDSFLLKHVPMPSNEVRIFEVGCGSGWRISRLAAELRDRGHSVVQFGCDYSSNALAQAERKGINVIHGGMDQLSEAGRADILVLSHVFEHFPDLKLALRQIERLVFDHTLIYIEVPGVINLKNRRDYGYSYQDYSVLAHTYNFSLSTLANVMARGGFGLVDGDEYIRAIFTKNTFIGKPLSGYQPIIQSLLEASERKERLERHAYGRMRKYLTRVVKALLGWE